MWSVVLAILLTLVSVLLMFIILLQRGRGGGLAGALGGMGGQSAFGTKAGDVFTKITIGMAFAWVVLAGLTGMAMFNDSQGRFPGSGNVPSEINAPATPDETDGGANGLVLPPGDDAPKTTEKPATGESSDDEPNE